MQATKNKTTKTQYEETGILFPVQVLNKKEVQYFRDAYAVLERFYQGNPHPENLKQLHLFFLWAYELATHPAVLDQVEKILGPNILVHGSSVFSKKPGGGLYVPWHQDGHYYGLNKPKMVSAWIALSDSNFENGCLRVLPRTHLNKYPHSEKKDSNNMLGSGMRIDGMFREEEAVNVILQAGEMSLHHINIVHGSNPNLSAKERVGYTVRYIAPEVRQKLIHHEVILARGQDNYGHYSLLKNNPIHEGVEQSVNKRKTFHQELLKRRQQFFKRKNQNQNL